VETGRTFVIGWKGIADFLGVHEDTAMIYERTRGLPVRRWGEKKPGARVYAIKAELNDWLCGKTSLATGTEST